MDVLTEPRRGTDGTRAKVRIHAPNENGESATGHCCKLFLIKPYLCLRRTRALYDGCYIDLILGKTDYQNLSRVGTEASPVSFSKTSMAWKILSTRRHFPGWFNRVLALLFPIIQDPWSNTILVETNILIIICENYLHCFTG